MAEWTWIPPANSGRQVEGAGLLPLGRYEMPDGTQQVSFGLPNAMLDAYRAMRYGLGFEQDPNAPQGYGSENAMLRGAVGGAGYATTGTLGAGAVAGVPKNALTVGGTPSGRFALGPARRVGSADYQRQILQDGQPVSNVLYTMQSKPEPSIWVDWIGDGALQRGSVGVRDMAALMKQLMTEHGAKRIGGDRVSGAARRQDHWFPSRPEAPAVAPNASTNERILAAAGGDPARAAGAMTRLYREATTDAERTRIRQIMRWLERQ